MTSLSQVAAFSIIALTVGIYFIVRSVRREAWTRRALSWVGVVLGTIFVAFGALTAFAGWTQRHTFAGPDQPTAEELARPVPAFTYGLLDADTTGTLPLGQQKVILLNLWATWCIPCLQEMPYIQRLQEEYGPEGLVVVTLTNEDRETAMTAAQRLPPNTINAFAPDQGALPQPIRRSFRKLPTSYVIDRAGFIQEFAVGSRDYERFAALVEPYL